MGIIGYSIGNSEKIDVKDKSYQMYNVEVTHNNYLKERKVIFADYPNDGITVNIGQLSENLQKKILIDEVFGSNNEKNNDFIYIGNLIQQQDGKYAKEKFYMVNAKKNADELFNENLDELKEIVEQKAELKKEEENKKKKEQAELKKQELLEILAQYPSNKIKAVKITNETDEKLKNKKSNQNNERKSYAIADIHGMWNPYIECMKKLKDTDTLYILGDVIDRGKDGIKILQDIIEREKSPTNNPKIKFISGNHEWMFFKNIKCINTIKKAYYEKNGKELDVISLINDYYTFFVKAEKLTDLKNEKFKKKSMSDEQFERLSKDILRITVEKNKIRDRIKYKYNISSEESMWMKLYLYDNKGIYTMLKYMSLPEGRQDEIYNYIDSSYVILHKNINDRDYLFVHAAVNPDDKELLERLKKDHKGITMNEVCEDKYRMSWLVEKRYVNETYREIREKYGFTTICGHDPICGRIIAAPENGLIRIDAGCGHKTDSKSKYKPKLAVYCIDDEDVVFLDADLERQVIDKQCNNKEDR